MLMSVQPMLQHLVNVEEQKHHKSLNSDAS